MTTPGHPQSPPAERYDLARIAGVVAVILVALAIVRYVSDELGRRPAEQFLRDFDVVVRRPADAATVAVSPMADLAANVTADIALSDALEPVALGSLPPAMRRRWLRNVERIDDELLAARGMTLDALATRPGWAYHWSMLGKLVYAAQRRRPDAPRPADARLWQEPLRVGMEWAPGDDTAATFAAGAYLETWPELATQARAKARQLFGRALNDPAFAATALRLLMATIGREETIDLLPQAPRTLRVAFETLSRIGDIEGAASLYFRWEEAEWISRASDLSEMEERAHLGDVEKLRELALTWMAVHPPNDFATAAGRKQVIRALQLAVNDRIGTWQSDPRGIAVRFLMNRRLSPERMNTGQIETVGGGAALGAAVSALTGVPDPTRARARLFAGEIYGAESLFSRSDSAGSLEWTPFLIDLAQFRLSQSMTDSASAALDSIASAARGECDALLARRQVERQSGSRPPADDAMKQIAAAPGVVPAERWSRSGTLSLCVDPDSQLRELVTTVDADAPTLIMWGWNDGREGSAFLRAGRTFLRVPLSGISGRNAFFIRTIAGGMVKPAETRIE
ncbi:MAG TPA: hypothetical protein VEZ11_16150 [Thermoanaerobaculia bacterium]|nr:hypothetical protein [Thermoanaerobaculia bacterium]